MVNRNQLVGLMIILMDSGVIQHLTDYKLAKFIEREFNYDLDKPMKNIKVEISKFRNLEKDPEAMKAFWKGVFDTGNIRPNVD